jgi:hypothetical protein
MAIGAGQSFDRHLFLANLECDSFERRGGQPFIGEAQLRFFLDLGFGRRRRRPGSLWNAEGVSGYYAAVADALLRPLSSVRSYAPPMADTLA